VPALQREFSWRMPVSAMVEQAVSASRPNGIASAVP